MNPLVELSNAQALWLDSSFHLRMTHTGVLAEACQTLGLGKKVLVDGEAPTFAHAPHLFFSTERAVAKASLQLSILVTRSFPPNAGSPTVDALKDDSKPAPSQSLVSFGDCGDTLS